MVCHTGESLWASMHVTCAEGNFEMPQTMLKDWNARDFGSTRQILLDKH